jgi:hypothetical protein
MCSALAGQPPVAARLSAAQIAEKNMAARGGLEAWRRIETMVWVGHIVSSNAPIPSMPFVLQQERPNKTRFEVTVNSQRSVRVFDGTEGWKSIPTHEGPPNVQPFTAQELKFARDAQGIDGPLIDYETKGNTLALEGSEKLEGRKAYRLRVGLPSGESHHVWIDAQSFLDVKSDRTSYNSNGLSGTVVVSYRNFQTVGGLQIPGVIETGAGPGKSTDRLVIEKVALNPPLDDQLFAKPTASTMPHAARVPATRAPPTTSPMTAAPPAPEATPRDTLRPAGQPAAGQ